ncbi:MAG TPA: MATE family efflux transporter [Vicinamibacterales bacterium]|nr:MATE family efflux transporter [Vicinamibacterales bacterium]
MERHTAPSAVGISRFRDLRQEFRPMFTLAVPVVMAELGWMTMGLVDTLMVGGLGPEAIGAVGIGSSLFIGVCIFAMGLLLGLDTLVAHAFGAGRIDECHRWLAYGVTLSLLLSIPVTIIVLALSSALGRWGLHPAVLALTQPYLDILAWSIPPLLLYASFRRYLQGMGVVRPVMIALVVANILNAFVNWLLIFGHWGAPALGVRGSAWGTVVARVVMAGVLLAVIVYRERSLVVSRLPRLQRNRPFSSPSRRFSLEPMRRLLALGLPAASQVTLEVGVFAAATALAGRLPPAALAAHQIAVNFVALTFMVPLGIASAGAVRVGHAIGRHDYDGAARSGWTAILFGVAFMSCAAAAFLLIPRALIGAFTSEPAVLSIGASLLFVGAIFQLFDGVQGVSTGVLRGLGDTRTPMLWNLAGHWFIGLPLGYTLCFVMGLGVVGLWWGLSTGLIICGIALLMAWSRHVASFHP